MIQINLISCSGDKKTVSIVLPLTLEQKALTIFKDSLIFQKIYSKPLQKDEIRLYSHNIDSTWIKDGIFSGYKLFSDGKSRILSTPVIDSSYLLFDTKDFTDSSIVEIKAYNDYYNKRKRDSTAIDLELPNGIEILDEAEFAKRNAEKELFVKVKKKLVAYESQMVEIAILKNREEPNSPKELRFLVYFDLNGNFLRWWFD